MNRSRTKKELLSDTTNDDFVPGTMAERIALVWPLTKGVASLSGYDECEEILSALSAERAKPMTIPRELSERP